LSRCGEEARTIFRRFDQAEAVQNAPIAVAAPRQNRAGEPERPGSTAIGRYLAENRLIPDLALVSPAARTRETWDLLAGALKSAPSAEFVPGLYGADASELLQIIRLAGQTDDRPSKSVMVVAHNPGLHELSLALIGKAKGHDREALAENLPTSGLAVFKFAVDDWDDLSVRQGTLERFVSPKLLRLQRESE
jgi:phosphohistidine phosphatase